MACDGLSGRQHTHNAIDGHYFGGKLFTTLLLVVSLLVVEVRSVAELEVQIALIEALEDAFEASHS